MNTEQLGNQQLKTFSLRKLLFVLIAFCLLYGVSYFADSFFGGYWMFPEMDGRDRYSFGLAMPTAVLWQPRFGHEAIGNHDLLGQFYSPLVHVDRIFLHPTIYLSDKNGFDKITHLPASKVHPDFRDDYETMASAKALCDETNQLIRCTLRLTGSDRLRSVTEIWMPREMALALEASPPIGFFEKPFGNYGKIKEICWIGKLSLPRDQNVDLAIPAKHPAAGIGTIRFECDLNEKTEVNHTIFCRVKLGEQSGSQTK
jgi:hypothetical protein